MENNILNKKPKLHKRQVKANEEDGIDEKTETFETFATINDKHHCQPIKHIKR